MAEAIRLAVVLGLLAAGAAEARFGKRSEPEEKEHSAQSANPDSASTSGDTHSASSATSASPPSATSHSSRSFFYGFAQPRACGYWSGAYVPWFGYGFRARSDEQVVSGGTSQVEPEAAGTRLTAGLETQFFGNGFNIGAGVGFEFGVASLGVSAANITVRADDGSNGWDHLQHVAGRLGFTVLSGQRGRWKVEAGADAVFAPDLVVVGPTVGTSGTVWLVGPLAAEGSGYWTFYPYDQLDFRLGAAVGIGPLGLRLGWRFQLLSDRGLVDGVVHTDVFTGPYTGLSLAL